MYYVQVRFTWRSEAVGAGDVTYHFITNRCSGKGPSGSMVLAL